MSNKEKEEWIKKVLAEIFASITKDHFQEIEQLRVKVDQYRKTNNINLITQFKYKLDIVSEKYKIKIKISKVGAKLYACLKQIVRI